MGSACRALLNTRFRPGSLSQRQVNSAFRGYDHNYKPCTIKKMYAELLKALQLPAPRQVVRCKRMEHEVGEIDHQDLPDTWRDIQANVPRLVKAKRLVARCRLAFTNDRTVRDLLKREFPQLYAEIDL